MNIEKNPKYDLRLQHRKALEAGTVLALVIVLFALRLTPSELMNEVVLSDELVIIEIEEIPITEQTVRAERPARPSIPIPSADEDIPEDETIEPTEIELDEIPPPPDMSESDINDLSSFQFVPYDEPPVMIGGMNALMKLLVYPEIGRKAGVEAHVIVGVLINQQGNPEKTQILKSSNSSIGFDQNAETALMKMKWKPAFQRDQPTKVWMSIPIRFRLRDPNAKS